MRIIHYEPRKHPRMIHYEPHEHPRTIHCEPHEHPKTQTIDPHTGLFVAEARPSRLNYIIRETGSVWRRHHHVKYERHLPVSCAAGDSLPHSWGY